MFRPFNGLGIPNRTSQGTLNVATDTTIVSGISGRYATALFDLARDADALDAVASDMGSLGKAIDESADLARVVRSPVLGRVAQGKAMAAILDKAGAHALTKQFVGLAAQNRRLFALPDMVRDFTRLLAQHRGEVAGEVVSAQPLSDKQLTDLKAQLKKAVGSEVRLNTRVDPTLLGGLIVKVGSRQVDGSLRTKLQNLKIAMKGAA